VTEVEKLKALTTYLGISPRRIELNPNWGRVIQGKKGFIRVQNGHWIAVVEGMSRRYSSSVRKKLGFMTMGALLEVVDNPLSDDPAVCTIEFRLDRMPDEKEAIMIRKILQIPRKRVLSDDAREALKKRFSKNEKGGEGT
jgi:hypothetical protein